MTLKQKTKIAYWVWNCCAIVAVAAVVVSHIPSVASKFTEEKEFYGDLFTLNKVSLFKQPIERKLQQGKTGLEEAKVIALGDSFFNVAYEAPKFAYGFERKTKIPTYHVARDMRYLYSPSRFFQDNPTAKPRILLWENVEREIVGYHLLRTGRGQQEGTDTCVPARLSKVPGYKAIEQACQLVFNPKPTVFLVENTSFTRPFFEQLYTKRFWLTGDISPRTPEYSVEPAMAFYDVELRQARYPLTDEDVTRIADWIQKEVETIRNTYDIETIYIPLPSKYTVYRQYAADDTYNNLLPRLIPELQRRGVRTIDALSLFEQYTKTHNELLYYPSDTHWNPTAQHIIIDEVVRILEEEKFVQKKK
ncbi:MAG TPA: hypothetical protein VJB65_02975 [Patescibacteria group bacterium]|nr:hypothetical protein [Patescibacteria group bacterium]